MKCDSPDNFPLVLEPNGTRLGPEQKENYENIRSELKKLTEIIDHISFNSKGKAVRVLGDYFNTECKTWNYTYFYKHGMQYTSVWILQCDLVQVNGHEQSQRSFQHILE